MIAVALDEGIVTHDEVLSVVERHGNVHESVAIDVISLVYQRRRDCSDLREMQRIFRHRHDSDNR
jgi:hypothetical protein